VTYVFTHQGWLYLAVILDLFSRRVVGWAASANNDRTLALDALGKAVTLRDPASGFIHLPIVAASTPAATTATLSTNSAQSRA
jgi:transposase InsO family protein